MSSVLTSAMRSFRGTRRSKFPQFLLSRMKQGGPSSVPNYSLHSEEVIITTNRPVVSYHTCYFSSIPSSSTATTDVAQSASVATATTSVPAHPIDFDVASKIEGNESQIVTINLEPGQILRAESGAMMYMTDGVEMNTTTGGGISAGFQRMLTVRPISCGWWLVPCFVFR